MTQKNRHLRTTEQLCRAKSSQSMYQQSEKKLVKRQYLLHLSSQYAELRPINGWDPLASLGRPRKFQRVSRVGFVTAPTSLNWRQPNFAICLALPCAVYTLLGLLPPDGILPAVKFTASKSSVLLYWRVTARHSSSGRQPKFAAWYKKWNYGTFADGTTYIRQGGHHIGYRPTF